MSQPAKSCGCAGKKCGHPCKPVLATKPANGHGKGGRCGAGAGGGGGGSRSDSTSCGAAGGCGCLGPFPPKPGAKPTK